MVTKQFPWLCHTNPGCCKVACKTFCSFVFRQDSNAPSDPSSSTNQNAGDGPVTSEGGQEGKAAVGNLLDLESELAFIQEVRVTNKLSVVKLLK